jgi:hypothetical protein
MCRSRFALAGLIWCILRAWWTSKEFANNIRCSTGNGALRGSLQLFKVTLYDENTDFIIFYIFIDLYSEAGGSRLPQVFFQNIKMRPKYNKKCYNHWFFCHESCNCNSQYVAWCNTRYRMCDLQPRLCIRGARQIFNCIFVWPI